MEPIYLGDGVYFSFRNGDVILTTGSHEEDEADNVIKLEPDVVIKLMKAMTGLSEYIKLMKP